ncbi:MAG: hypothetical protein CSB49_00840 [Proteobacteria bacterium]|nr:MAG: hypothetical protein CSB49_00840 [Pseudomonadota bacterium]
MDAKELPDLVVDYLYDELDPERRAAFEAALPNAPDVRAEVEAFQSAREAFAELDEVDVPSTLSDKLMAEAVRVAPAPQRKSQLERIRAALSLMVMHPAVSAAAVMVVVLGVSLYVYRYGGQPSPEPKVGIPTLPAGHPVALHEAAKRELKGRTDKRPQNQGKTADKALAQVASADDVKHASRGSGEVARLSGRSWGKGGRFKKRGPYRGRKADRMRKSASEHQEPAAVVKRRPLNPHGNQRVLTKSDQRARQNKKEKTEGFASSLKPKLAKAAKPGKRPVPRDREREAKAQQTTAQRWLELGSSAVASKRCPEAFDYFTRALKAKPSLLPRVNAQLGSCRAALRRSGSHAWLRSRIHRQERRPARHKARRRKVLEQRAQEAK